MNISVIIPTYNRSHTLPRSLDAILSQIKRPKELIIVNDGSMDRTQQLIESYQEKFYKKNITLVYLEQKNHGVSHARNQGILKARYNWIAFLDSDDGWQKSKLASQVKKLDEKPEFKVCHSNELWIRHGVRVNSMKKHEKKGGWIYQHCLPLCAMSPSSMLIHKEVFAQVGLFDESLPACEDYELWLRITSSYPVLYCEEPLTVKYGGHNDQLSTQYWGMDRFRIYALKKILARGKLSKEDKVATVAMLNKKIAIYVKGAKKRGKLEEAERYQAMLLS